MIDVHDLRKFFGSRAALRGINLSLTEGETVAVVGPNGAGKTTLLRIVAGLTRPSGGSASVAGFDLTDDAQEARRCVGFISHQPLLYEDLSGEENLHFYGRMYDVVDLKGRAEALLEQVGLKERGCDWVRTYSRGMRQRLAIARALLHDPPVLVLDEPYTGLDRGAAEMLDAVLAEADLGSRTVLLTTHNLENGLRHSSRVAVLVNGVITYETGDGAWDPGDLRSEYQRQTSANGG